MERQNDSVTDFEEAVATFHDEYARTFPAGGDGGDHDEAIRCGIEAVLVPVLTERDRLRAAIEDYLLWDPRQAGHAAATRRLAAVLKNRKEPQDG